MKQYKEDIKEGFHYLKKEKGITNIYTYMAISNGTYEGSYVALQAYFQTNPMLSVMMLGFLRSAEMVGRVLSGIFQYRFEIPAKKRFDITKFVYITYQLADMILLFTPYSAMIVNRFICGGFGNTSATVRETAVQSYLPDYMRARVNAVFNAVFSVGGILFQILAGMLGEILPYRTVIIIMGTIGLAAIWIFIIRPGFQKFFHHPALKWGHDTIKIIYNLLFGCFEIMGYDLFFIHVIILCTVNGTTGKQIFKNAACTFSVDIGNCSGKFNVSTFQHFLESV